MADPIIVKVSELPELMDLAAGDLITTVDISEAISANKTKKLQAGNLKVFATAQLADSIVTVAKLADDAVESAKIKDLNVTTGKLAAKAVTAAKIADNTITATQMATGAAIGNIATGAIATAKLADNAVTEAKLGAIKRTIIIPIAGDEDDIIVKNYPRKSAWAAMLDTHTILSVAVVISGAVSSSGVVTVAVSNAGGVAATVSVSQGEFSASTTTIVEAYKTAAAFAPIGINVTAAGVGAKGLSVYLEVLG